MALPAPRTAARESPEAMVSCAARDLNARAMHVVIIGWLFVIGTMALALSSPLAAAAFFVGVGLAPVALVVWLAARRRR